VDGRPGYPARPTPLRGLGRPRAWRASKSRSRNVAAWRGSPAPERYTGVRVAASGRVDLGVCSDGSDEPARRAANGDRSCVVSEHPTRLAWVTLSGFDRARPGRLSLVADLGCRRPETRGTTRKTRGSEAYLPAQHQEAGEESRFQAPDVDARRKSDHSVTQTQRPPQAHGLIREPNPA
jgi:hypothetical protein